MAGSSHTVKEEIHRFTFVPDNDDKHSSINIHSQAAKQSTEETDEIGDDEFWPLTGKPYFHMILTKSNLRPSYMLILPAKIHRLLPSAVIPVVLTSRGKNWEGYYHGDGCNKRISHNWRKFVLDNDLKAGDACVFELAEHSCANLKFRVQILRGDLPTELQAKVNSLAKDKPFIID